MSEAPIEALQQAIEGLHGCKASFDRTEMVRETFKGAMAWVGTVHVFDLQGHETASVAYAWSEEVPGTDRRRFHAILQAGPVETAQDAVRAAIVSNYRDGIGDH